MKYLLYMALLISVACSSTRTIKDGRVAYDHKQYATAIPLLEEEYRGESDQTKKAELAYFLGEANRNNNHVREASKWYDKAIEMNYGPKAIYEMAYILKKLEKYELAARYFKEILKYSDRKDEIRKEILKCQEGQKLQALVDENGYEVKSMAFNTDASEYSPQFLAPDLIIYTSDEKSGLKSEYKWTGRGFSDLMAYDVGKDSAKDYSGILNTKDNEGSAVFSQNREQIFFTRCYYEETDHFCKILMAEKDGDSWSTPTEVFPMDPKLNYRDPVLIENDSVLIFSCDDPKGYGATDLYYSVLEEDKWSAPDLMPPSINTIGFERFPTSNDDTLYFSSSFLAGMGGLDIFKTYLKSDNSWSPPVNMGAPFNSSGDDFGLVFSPYKKDYVAIEGYFTSDRKGKSKDDIYHFVKKSDEKIDTAQHEPIETIEESEKIVTTVLKLRVLENSYAIDNDPNSLLLGQRPVESASVIVDLNGERETFTTDEKGNVLISVEASETYNLLAGKKEYLNARSDFSFEKEDIDIEEGLKTFSKVLVIDRIFTDVEITMDDIYYDFDKSFIRDDAKPALDELYTLLIDNPALNIQLSSHTDCQGEEDYNEELSQKRAEAAVTYIIQKGIATNRIIAKGYGESLLAITCNCDDCSEDEHQLNRRTTFKILR